jgi:hypothetical protein
MPSITGKITLRKFHVSTSYHPKLRKVQWIVFPDLRTPTRTSPGMGDGHPGEAGMAIGKGAIILVPFPLTHRGDPFMVFVEQEPEGGKNSH